MRRLLLALPFALLPLAMANAAPEHDHDHEHGSLGAHEHGVGRLDVALVGGTLEFELDSPAMNLVGFEHLATSAEDKAKVAAAKDVLLKPHALFSIPEAAECNVVSQKLESPLFGDKPEADAGHDAKDAHDEHEHSEIHGTYKFTCKVPAVLKTLDLSTIFKSFPGTEKLQVQLISPKGQSGAEVRPSNPSLKF
ncbi:DUF2796 domain-containing protein [Pseudomonas quasicaspiana]|uniref:DUF2796 domain-containing protein n=1 Tax=Pseudomonas quasicaspiana TaxID=2829821 RepID=UPI001E64B5B7|nr:DUF2796 domain-containing protein [Pseudomonas quasicaspiana]MCD5970579.1 DUF2796 domain-containing protein [Pseudomonas quasicaspiana]